ncbi:hypothetical protein [Ruania halotolerans]|uniref:hypothetical protein n=1 Tax=Ruania halotolerans TaxID=2897773 RepID=UPI001E378D69|nr:hypothetical protein [Ruania halotolerans]UFU08261.1 hypothetical protein LQF10_09270 [Ruania halotolerans]
MLVLSGCAGTSTAAGGGSSSGDAAVWELTDPGAVDPPDRVLTIGVIRLDCASGFTGEPLPAQVAYEDDRVVVTVDVEPLELDAANCQGNPAVPMTVVLDEALGERELVDGACLEGDAVGTSFCSDAVRWGP